MYNEEKTIQRINRHNQHCGKGKLMYENMLFTSFKEYLMGTAPSMFETAMVLVMILTIIPVGLNNFGIVTGFGSIFRCFSTVNVAAAYFGTLSGMVFLSSCVRYIKYARKNVAVI